MLAPLPILLYHRVDHSGQPTATRPEVFAGHMAWLADHGYRTLRCDEAARVLAGEAAAPERAVVITFDDGYADLATEVAPVLRRHDFNATAFLITSLVTDPTENLEGPGEAGAPPIPGDRDHVSWPEVRALATEGVLAFHSHTHSHVRWPLDSMQTAVVADDIDRSRAMLAHHLGEPEAVFSHLAWPWGRVCPSWETEALKRGLSTQYLVQRGAPNRQGRLQRLPRLMVDGVSVEGLARWMSVLGRGPGAFAANQLFGTVRRVRQGVSYR